MHIFGRMSVCPKALIRVSKIVWEQVSLYTVNSLG